MKAFVIACMLVLLQDPAVERAQKTLAKTPDDPSANLVMGSYHAERANWDVALPHFEKAKNPEIRAAVEAEKKLDGNQFTCVEVGDAWVKALPKAGVARQACFDRMNVHYATAWPKLEDFARSRLRDRLGKLYLPVRPGKPSTEVSLEGWGGVLGAAAKIEVVTAKVRSGACALRFSPKDPTKGTLASSKPVPVVPGKKLEVSAWVLTDGTDSAGDGFKFVVRDAKGGIPWSTGEAIRPDFPVWYRISGETVLPDDSFSIEVHIGFLSKAGALFVDDISFKMDGKELWPKGGFEP
jgi:hypothetical protein